MDTQKIEVWKIKGRFRKVGTSLSGIVMKKRV